MGVWMGLYDPTQYADEHRKPYWRDKILEAEPNGDVPITALTSKMKSEETTDIEFNWWVKSFPEQGGAVAGIYVDAGLAQAYSTPQGVGSLVYAKVTEDVVGMFVPGASARFCMGDDDLSAIVAQVVSVKKNGAKSYLEARLIRADGGSTATLGDCDYVMRVGSAHAPMGKRPMAIHRNAVRKRNVTQTFRNSLELSGRELHTEFRTQSKYLEKKGEVAKQHARDIEQAFRWGEYSYTQLEDGSYETTTKGIFAQIRDEAPDNILNFAASTDSMFKGKTWDEAGEVFLEYLGSLTMKYGEPSRMVVGGLGAMMGITRAAKASGKFDYTAVTTEFGMKVVRFVAPWGVLDFYRDPLMSVDPLHSNSAFVIYPGHFRYRYLTARDTQFKQDINNPFAKGAKVIGNDGIDGIAEEFLTDAGLELWFPEQHAFVSGIGIDNTVV